MLKIRAAAKINLCLDIVGKRADGYHLLETIMQSVDLFDEVSIELINSGIVVNSSDSTLGDKNDITYRAAKLFFEQIKSTKGVKINVIKKIPISAGLGGGSTDAAAVLLGLNQLFDNPLNKEQLCELALKLGADVPYFLYGGTVLVEGIGEICTPIKNLKNCYIVLAKKETKKSTKYMYDLIDNCEQKVSVATQAVIEKIENRDLFGVSKLLNNSFSIGWDNSEINAISKKYNPLTVSLSGSGPTFFVLFDNENNAKKCVKELLINGYETYLTQPINKAIIVE